LNERLRRLPLIVTTLNAIFYPSYFLVHPTSFFGCVGRAAV
jgi:hypothetical protein